MAIVVEPGTGLANADAYVSVADADAWHAAAGITTWATLTTPEKEQAIVRATRFMVQHYRAAWAGVRYTETQALDWPRAMVPMRDGPGSFYPGLPSYYPEPSVPQAVRNACAELALRAAAGDLAPDVARLAKREKVDVVEVEYADGAAPWTTYRAIDALLAPFFKSAGSGSTIRLVRA